MPAEAYKVRAAVEPGSVVDHDSMGRHELAGLLEGIATRLRASETTEITRLWIAPAETDSAQWAIEHGGGAYRSGDISDVPRPPGWDEEKTHPGFLSKCHQASVHAVGGTPDFPGRVGEATTCWFVCDECGEPCNLIERGGDDAER